MHLAILAFFLGITEVLWLTRRPHVFELFVILFFMALSGINLFYSNNKIIKLFCRLLIIFCMGFLWAILNGCLVISHRIPPFLFDKNLLINGEIVSFPKYDNYQDSFLFMIDTIAEYPDIAKKSVIQVHVNNYYNKNKVLLKVGDVWQFNIKLRAMHGLANPGGFDAEKVFFQHRIQASATVQNNPANHLLYSSIFHQPINIQLKQYLR